MIPSSDPRLTAYALGEMTEAEKQAFEAELMKSDPAQHDVAELTSAAELLRGEFSKHEPSSLTAEQKKKIEEALDRRSADSDDGSSEEKPVDEKKAQPKGATPVKLATVTPIKRSFLVRAATIGAPIAVAAGVIFAVMVTGSNKDSAGGWFAAEEQERAASTATAKGEAAAEHANRAKNEAGDRANRRFKPASSAVAQATAAADAAAAPNGAPVEVKATDPAEVPAKVPANDPLPENGFVETSKDVKSTFSVDVDTASYSIVRRLLQGSQMPQAGNVRIEEMVNYFKYSYPEPNDAAFGVYTDATSAPWAQSHRLVRIGLKGKTMQMQKRPASNLVFLVDASGSMDGADRIELLKKGFEMLVEQLDERDTVSIVVYAGASGLVLPPTKANEKRKILDALSRLKAGGSTNGGSGIKLAYETAKSSFIEGGTNRVILATDGDFNVGVTSRSDLTKLIEEKAQSGVFLTVLGFGLGNTRDNTMETLADKGNGNYAYIDSLNEARKVLVEQASGTLHTIAKDVKIQISFDPKTVQSFRLIGYENRVMAHEDFTNDKKDAGDIGAGHTVTALYEVVTKAPVTSQTHLADVALRYKQPDGVTSQAVETTIVDSGTSFESASTDLRFAASVASFGMLLRGSAHKGDLDYADVLKWANAAIGDDPDGYRKEFVGLVGKASELSKR